MTILADELIPGLDNGFTALGAVRTFSGRDLTNQKLRAANADVLLVRSTTTVNGALLEGTSVRFIGSATAGIDHVDTDWLAANSIAFAYAPGSNAWAVVQYVLTAIDRLRSVPGSTIGIIGYGNVGRRLATVAEALGMVVLVNDPLLDEAGTLDRAHTSLPDLLEASDVVTVHVPLTTGGAHPTHHLLHADNLNLIPPGTLLINTARGGVVDEAAIPDGIDVVLDVFEDEPHLHRSSVERALLVTPHIAGHTINAKHRGAHAVERALRAWIDQTAEPVAEHTAQADPLDVHAVQIDARRLDSDLRTAWLADPTPQTFDRCRKAYVLV